MKLIYLASIYSVEDECGCKPSIYLMKHRRDLATIKAAELMQAGYNVFSPLTHSDPIADYISEENRFSHDFWLERDFDIIKRCDELWVYCLPQWDKSYGIQQEIKFAKVNNIPIKYINEEGKEANEAGEI